jgi:hypothetical protein
MYSVQDKTIDIVSFENFNLVFKNILTFFPRMYSLVSPEWHGNSVTLFNMFCIEKNS